VTDHKLIAFSKILISNFQIDYCTPPGKIHGFQNKVLMCSHESI